MNSKPLVLPNVTNDAVDLSKAVIDQFKIGDKVTLKDNEERHAFPKFEEHHIVYGLKYFYNNVMLVLDEDKPQHSMNSKYFIKVS